MSLVAKVTAARPASRALPGARALATAAGLALVLGLGGCARNKSELVVDDSVGVSSLRNPCPVVEVAEQAGDVTLFSAPDRTDAGALDVVAAITNLRSRCSGDRQLATTATFDVVAHRYDSHGARRVVLPYFSVVMRGGTAVIAKRVGQVTLDFADGQDRTVAHAQAGSVVDRAEATLPESIRRRLNRKRKAGEADAAVDPFSLPDVKRALTRAFFEQLVGFQLTDAQLAYNARR